MTAGFMMETQMAAFVTLLLIVLSGPKARVTEDGARTWSDPNGVTMTIVESKVTEETLDVRYRIINGLQRDIWICESMFASPIGGGTDYEVYLSEDEESLVVRRRLNVPGIGREFVVPPVATYLRLSGGQQRLESIILPLPVRPVMLFYPRRSLNVASVTHLRMEIGYHESTLPEEIVKRQAIPPNVYALTTDRARVLMCPYPDLRYTEYVKREQVIWAETDVPCIVYLPEAMCSVPNTKPPTPPDLSSCTRVNVEYQPSLLEYFFPDPEERGLLSETEKNALRLKKTVSTGREELIKALRDGIGYGTWGLVVGEETSANVLCYTDDKISTSFTVYGDRRLQMNDGQQFRYVDPLTSLRSLVPDVEPYRLRAQRARIVRSLWYEIRVWNRTVTTDAADSFNENVIRYPPASQWNDAIRETHWGIGVAYPTDVQYREGTCEYAMDPDCRPNSSGETVLLFETSVGWNRHGGPELFTFKHYDPRGGLVLLNDGTVKFIRTEEELKQLRWK